MNKENQIISCYRNTANDYFMRLGGSGVYDGFEDWHPAFLTIGCAIQVKDDLTFDALEPVSYTNQHSPSTFSVVVKNISNAAGSA